MGSIPWAVTPHTQLFFGSKRRELSTGLQDLRKDRAHTPKTEGRHTEVTHFWTPYGAGGRHKIWGEVGWGPNLISFSWG
jgi:hypothetical protein